MGKKGKKSRFNQVVDIDITYSSNSVIDGTAEQFSDLNLTKEKVDELQRIKAQLPSAPQAVRLEDEVARIPEHGPFRLVLVNVSFSATKVQIEEFLLPVVPTNIRIAEEDGRFRGYCFIDFANRNDLAAALEKNGSFLLARRVNMRIADQQNDRSGGFDREGGFSRRRTGGFDSVPQGAPVDGWHRRTGTAGAPPASQSVPQNENRWVPRTVRAGQEPVAVPAAPVARPVIKFAPRTKPVENNNPSVVTPRQRSIFGDAKPVDTATREREIEEASRAKTTSSAMAARQRNIFGNAKPIDTAARDRQLEAEQEETETKQHTVPTSQKLQPATAKKKEEPKAVVNEAPKQPVASAPKHNAWAKPLV